MPEKKKPSLVPPTGTGAISPPPVDGLQDTRLLLETIVDSTSDLIWSVDPKEFGLLSWNRAFKNYFSRQRGIDIKVGDRPQELFPPGEFVERWQSLYRRALKHAHYKTEYKVFAGTITLELNFSLLKRAKQVLGISVFGRDITDRKQAEQALLQEHESYRRLFENSGTGVIIVDEDGRYLMVNQIAASKLGATSAQVIGRSMYDFLPREQAELYLERNRRLIRSHGRREYEDSFQLPSGERSFLIVDQFLPGGEGWKPAVQSSSIDITDRKQIEEALKQSEQLFRLLTEKSVIGIYIIQDSKMAYVNPSFARVFGYIPEEIIDRLTPSDLIHPDDIRAVMTRLGERLDGMSASGNQVYRGLKKDGSVVFIEVYGVLIDFKGRSAVMGTLMDVTERTKAGEDLRESEDQFRYMFEYSVAPKSITQLSGELQVNQAFADMLGYSRDELRNCTWQELTHPDDVENNEKIIQSFLSGEISSARFTKRFLHKNGSIVWADLGTGLRRSPDGKPLYLITTINDITEAKQAVDALKQRESYLTAILENQPGLVWLKDQHGRFLAVNRAFALACGKVSPIELTGLTDLDIWPNELAEKYRRDDARIMAGKSSDMLEELIQDRGKNTWVETYKTPVLDAAGNVIGTTGFSRDITDRRQAEAALQESETRYRGLFEDSPVALWEEDFSELKRLIDGYKRSGVTDFRAFFTSHPDELLACVKGIKVLDVNQATLSMLGASRKEQLIGNLYQVARTQPLEFIDEFVDIAMGRHIIKWDGTTYDLHGRKLIVSLHWAAVSGYEQSLERVLVSVLDITEREQAQTLQQAVYRVAAAAETTASLDELYPQIHQIVASVMPAENFYIALYDKAKNLLHSPYFRDHSDEPFIESIPVGRSASAYVLRTGKALLGTQAVFEDLNRRGEVTLVGGMSAIWLGAPLNVAGETIGVMAVQHYSDPSAYGERELHMLEYVSTQVATAISRKQADQQLRASEEKFRSITEQMTDLVYQTDDNGLITYISPASTEIFGYLPSEMEGRLFTDFLAGSDTPRALAAFTQALGSGEPSRNLELSMRRKDGSQFLGELNGSIYRRQAFTGSIGLIRDITRRKNAEDEIRRLNASLEQRVEERTRALQEAQTNLLRQEKLATLGQLAAGVGHELRNPLGAINTSAYYLKLVLPEATDKVRQHLDMIEQEVNTASRIIGDLLDFGRVVTPDRQNISAAELVQRTLKRFMPPASIRVVCRIPAGLPQVFVDPLHVEQMLGNLITNAWQAMPAPTADSLHAGKAAGRISIRAALKKDRLAIAVTDTGSGITPENMTRLFEPLFTTKARGIGIGLAVSQKLAEANQASITVTSLPGRGSTFTLHLPLAS